MLTRWKVDKWTSGQVCIMSERGLICTMESGNDETRKQDAAQIVREHNAHEAMREALESAHTQMTHFEDAWKQAGVNDIYEEVVSKMEAALRLAKGE